MPSRSWAKTVYTLQTDRAVYVSHSGNTRGNWLQNNTGCLRKYLSCILFIAFLDYSFTVKSLDFADMTSRNKTLCFYLIIDVQGQMQLNVFLIAHLSDLFPISLIPNLVMENGPFQRKWSRFQTVAVNNKLW